LSTASNNSLPFSSHPKQGVGEEISIPILHKDKDKVFFDGAIFSTLHPLQHGDTIFVHDMIIQWRWVVSMVNGAEKKNDPLYLIKYIP